MQKLWCTHSIKWFITSSHEHTYIFIFLVAGIKNQTYFFKP